MRTTFNATRWAVIESKFHGGGILWQGTSLREAWRALRRLSDGCFDGRGCQRAAFSFDRGESWYEADLHHDDSRALHSPYRLYYADGWYGADVDHDRPVRQSDDAWGAADPAL